MVVISQTKTLASAWAEATKSSLRSFDMQKAESSGDTPSKRSFSGLRKDYLTFD